MATVIILLIIVLIVAGLIWMLRGRQAPVQRRSNLDRYEAADTPAPAHGGIDKLKNNPMFWGLEMGQPGCAAAQELLGRQFPFDEAPELPLPGCDAAMCNCQFKGLTNRRRQQRRHAEDRRKEIRFETGKSSDRRSRKDRRRGDKWNDHTL